MIPPAIIQIVVNKTNIVELIASCVPLKQRGSDFSGICPFDGCGKPTIIVSPDKHIWKCFKCGRGGNAIRFVMELHEMSFPMAVAKLAEQAGVKIPETDQP